MSPQPTAEAGGGEIVLAGRSLPPPDLLCRLGHFILPPNWAELVNETCIQVFSNPLPGDDDDSLQLRAQSWAVAAVLRAATPRLPII